MRFGSYCLKSVCKVFLDKARFRLVYTEAGATLHATPYIPRPLPLPNPPPHTPIIVLDK